MNDLLAWAANEVQTNDMLTGIIGGSLMASILYSLREVPGRIRSMFWEVSTSTMTLNSEKNSNFNEALYLFRNTKPLIRHKNFSVVPIIGDDEDDDRRDEIGLGYGTHYFRLFGTFCKVVLDSQNEGMRFRESLSITAFTRNGFAFFALLNSAIQKRKVETRHVYEYQGWWRRVVGSQERTLESVALPQEQKDRICGSITAFLGRKQWYVERGIPWRLSLLFEGRPGTGKTSMAVALAAEFQLPLYYLSLSSLESDADLFDAMRSVPAKSIVVIEDIDCAFAPVSKKRTAKKVNTSAAPDDAPEEDAKPISLSGLLNSIDGILAPQGRVLIMTTNHAEKLDEALLRPGRVDLREVFEGDNETKRELYLRIAGTEFGLPLDLCLMTPAEVQAAAITQSAA